MTDVLIILGVVLSLFRGREVGFVRQFFSTAGFFSGLFAGAFLQRYTVRLADDELSKGLVTIVTSIGMALIGMAVGEYLGLRIKRHIQPGKFNRPDIVFGSLLAAISLLLVVWLSTAIFTALPSPGLQAAINESRVINYLNDRLPPAPSVIARLGRLIDPNGFPQVFTGREPVPGTTTVPPSLDGFDAAIKASQTSVVIIKGTGCGGVVEGSGFVVGEGLVATNAHVVAGINRPYIYDDNGVHRATAIWFDPDLDFAILRTTNLAGKPMALKETVQPNGTRTAALGYPGGGPFDVEAAVILDQFTATGRNIYGRGETARDIYELDAEIIPGNSGGPIITSDGKVVGVIFAESTTYPHVGYALTAKKVASEIRAATLRNEQVSTSSCTP